MGLAALLCAVSLLEVVAGSALDNDSIKTAVALWLSDSAAAEAAYGPHFYVGHLGGDGHVVFVLRAFKLGFLQHGKGVL